MDDSKIGFAPVEKNVRNLPMVLVSAFYTNNNLPRLDKKWAKHQVWMVLGSGPILWCKTTILRMRPAGLLNTLTKESIKCSGPFFFVGLGPQMSVARKPQRKKNMIRVRSGPHSCLVCTLFFCRVKGLLAWQSGHSFYCVASQNA